MPPFSARWKIEIDRFFGKGEVWMIARERVLATLRRKTPDRVPIFMRMTPPVLEKLKEKTGHETPEEYFDFEVREITLHPTRYPNDYRSYFE